MCAGNIFLKEKKLAHLHSRASNTHVVFASSINNLASGPLDELSSLDEHTILGWHSAFCFQ